MSKRKKIIIASIILFVTLFCISFVILDSVSKKLYIDETTITKEIVYDDDFDYSQISIIDKSLFSEDKIPITDDMIVIKIDPIRPGNQTIVIEYSDKRFEIQVTVKFKIEFVVDNEVIDTQMVLSKDEIIYPSEPLKNGYDFLGWSDIPDELTGNLQIEAIFDSGEYTVPELTELSAQYGDTLDDFNLPSNKYGAWEFTSSPDTLVGNPGTSTFGVRFVPIDSNRPIINDTVTIEVSKRKIDFINVVDTFIYNGQKHKPTFELSENVDVEVIYYGFERTEIINEPYALEINSDFYEGSYEGELVINKCPITITVNNYEITYGEALPTIEWNVLGTENIANIGISLVELPSKLNAGEYDLDVSVLNGNYDPTINKGTLKINKATLDVVNPDYLNTAVYSELLSNVEFNNNYTTGSWSWKNPLAVIDTPTTFTATAVFTPNDTINYEIIERELTIDVYKKTLGIVINENEFEYDGNPHRASFTIGDGSVEGINVKYSIDSVEFDGSKIDAGNYRIKIEIVDERYQGSNNYDLVITQAQNTITELSIEDWVYGATPNQPDATSRFDSKENITFTYSTEENGAYSEEVPTNAGTYYVKAKSFGTSNYISCEKTASFTISKRNAEVNWVVAESYTYTGDVLKKPTASIELVEGTKYELIVSTTKVFKDAGDYSFTASTSVLDILNNYTINNKVKVITVLKANAAITGFKAEGWTYGEEAKEPIANTNFGNIAFTYATLIDGEYTTTVPTNAGTYYVKASVIGTDNYTGYETEAISLTISKKSVSVSWNIGSYTYTGNVLTDPKASITLVDGTSQALTVSTENEFKNAGTYTFTASIEDSLIATNYTITNASKDVTVEKGSAVITDFKAEGWTYGEAAKEPIANTNFGNIAFTYATLIDGEYTTTVPTNAGKYYVKASVIGTDNYTGYETEAISLTISKKSVSVSWNIGSYTYTGNVLTDPTASITLVDGTSQALTVSTENEFKNAGTYTFTASIEDSLIATNYTITNASKDVTVEKGSAVITDFKAEGWTYGEAAKEPIANTNFGNIAFTYATLIDGEYTTTVPTNAGKYYVKASVIGTDNYTGYETEAISLTISKKSVSVSWNIGSYTYTGSELTKPTASIPLVDGTSQALTVSTIKDFINAGTYTFTASTVDTSILDNYDISNTTKNVTVSKATAEITGLTIDGWKYGETPNAPTTDKPNFGSIVYAYFNKITEEEIIPSNTTNAGTYYVKATVAGTENYDGAVATFEFTISKKEVDVNWVVGNYTYTGSELTKPTVSIPLVDGTDYELTVSTDNEFKNAGNYTFKAEITDSVIGNNYQLTNDTYDVIVDKKEVVAPVIDDLLYTGEHQAPSISDTDIYTVIENAGGTNAGTYYVKLELKDFNNYKWSTSTEAIIKVYYDIYLNDNEWKINPSISDITYGEEVNPQAEAKFGTVSITYIYPDGSSSSEKPTNAGEYKAVFTAAAEGYKTLTETVSFKINKAKYTPIVPSGLTAQYGDLISSVAIETTDDGTWSLVSDKLTFDSVGTVTMKAQFVPANTNYYADPIDVQIEVTKRMVTIVIIQDEFTYNGSIQYLQFIIYNGDTELLGIEVLGNTGLTNAGSVSQTLTINSEYYQGSITHTLTITKKIVNVISIQSKEYTGEVLTADIKESTLYTVTENLGGTNVGFYNVVLTLTDSSNHKWDTTESSSVELEFEITKANAAITDFKAEGWTYGEAAKEPTAKTNFGTIVFTYSTSLDGEYTTTVPTNAGTYYVKASVLGTENYNGYETTATSFTISKKSVSVIWNVGSYTYTGNVLTNPTASITLVDGTDYELTVSTTKEFKNVGTYTFTASTEDTSITNNYEISNTTKDVTVEKGNAEIKDFAVSNIVYGSSISPAGTSNFGEIVYLYSTSLDGEYTTTVPTNAGTYYVKASVLGTENYNGYETTAISFTISKKSVSVIWNIGSYIYTGNVLTNPTASITLVDGTDYELTVSTTKEFKNVGTYTFTASTEETSITHNYEISNTTKDVTVEKGSAVITDFKAEGWTYGEAAKEPTANTNFGSIAFTYATSIDGEYTTTVPTNAGTYYVKASVLGTENYNGYETEAISLTISKKSVSISWNIGSYTYTGNVLTDPTASITLVDGTSYSLTVSSIVEFKNAGTYTFTASIEDSLIATNYTIINASKDVTVEKGSALITDFKAEGWTYGETAKVPTANANFGSIIFTYSSTLTGTYTNTVPTNAGTYYVKASVPETDNYYGDETEPISFTIAKATPTVVWPEYNNTNYEDRFNPETDYSNTPSTNGTFIFDEITYSNTFSSTITITVTFKPTDSNNYLELTNTITVTMSPVAYIGSTNYGTVEKALNAAVSGNTVYVIIGTNPIIKANCYIKSGVTLALPYEGTTTLDRNGSAATFGDETASLVASNMKTNLTIKEGITLTIESGGTLTIGGVLGHAGIGISAQTSGSYCQITLEANAKIASEGSINCFGFIKEDSLDNGSQVICTSGNVNMPFVVYDYRGGTSTSGSYSKGGIAPFNVYDIPNIQSIFTLHSTATLTAYVDLYASSKHNTSTATIITDSSGLLILNSGSYVTFKYTPENFGYTTKLGRTNVKIYGGASTGSMSMDVGTPVDTANVLFGISWKFDYELYSGTYTINNKYKFMTGSSLFVNSDAILNVDGSLIFYQEFKDVYYGSYVYPTKNPAKFIMNGILNINGSFGGVVETTVDNAIINASSTATLNVTSKEGHATSITKFNVAAVITEYFSGYPYGSDSITRFGSGKYTSLDNSWYSEYISIYYDTNGGEIASSSEGPYKIDSNGYILNNVNVANPTKEHYTFGGWYFDSELTTPVGGQKIYTSIYVYAKWIPVEYTITYQNIFENCSEEEITNTNLSKYNIESYFALTTPTSVSGLTFIGWFTDSACTQAINAIDGSLYGTDIIIYCLWNPVGTSKYTVNIVTNNTDYDDEVLYFFETKTEAFLLPDYSLKNTDKEYSKYFLGFYIDDENTLVDREYIINNIASLAVDNKITIYGKWVDKYKITLKDYSITLYVYNQTVTLPSISDYDTWVDNTDYISHIQKYWLGNGVDYYYADGNTTFTATCDTEFELTQKESKYFAMLFSLTNASVTVKATNGIVLDTSGTIYSSISPGSGDISLRIYVLEGVSVSLNVSYSYPFKRSFTVTPKGGTSSSNTSFTMDSTTYTVNISSSLNPF